MILREADLEVARVRVAIVSTAVWLALVGIAAAQNVTLSVSPGSFTFPSADPDLSPVVTAPALTVTCKVSGNPHGNWRLTVLAGDDLVSGAQRIDISNVSWTATPAPPFQAGTVSKTVAQTLASGSGNVNQTGSVTFALSNSWTYTVGTYTVGITFTLSAP